MNTPTPKELKEAFNKVCFKFRNYNSCPLGNCSSQLCKITFTQEVLTGKRNLDGTLIPLEKCNESPKIPLEKCNEPHLPSWCKVGQWCLYTGDADDKLVIITKVDNALVTYEDKHGGGYYITNNIMNNMLKPVRFREYRTVEQAKHLLHKYAESDCDGGRGIYWIDRIFPRNDGKILINGYGFEFLTKLHTTIDGVPIGVPEVDEEAMKED